MTKNFCSSSKLAYFRWRSIDGCLANDSGQVNIRRLNACGGVDCIGGVDNLDWVDNIEVVDALGMIDFMKKVDDNGLLDSNKTTNTISSNMRNIIYNISRINNYIIYYVIR